MARYDDKLVGFIEAEREWTKESYLKHLVSITKMFADKDYQQEKIGKELIRGMINLLAKDETITALDLRVVCQIVMAMFLHTLAMALLASAHRIAKQHTADVPPSKRRAYGATYWFDLRVQRQARSMCELLVDKILAKTREHLLVFPTATTVCFIDGAGLIDMSNTYRFMYLTS